MVVIRLSRTGAKKRPFYHICVTDRRKRRDSNHIEKLGFFNPIAKKGEEKIRLDVERFDYWTSVGAIPSDTVMTLYKRSKLSEEDVETIEEKKLAQKQRRKERDELKSVLEKETKEVDKEEMDALKSILELKELTVEDILIPINEVLKIEIGDKSHDVPSDKDIFLPVVKRNSDEILGFIHSKEMEQFNEFSGDNIDFLIEPYYVPEKTHLFSQLKNFQKNGKEVALVVDEYGDITGLVTLEDLIEQVLGRFDPDENEIGIGINEDNSVTVDGSVTIRELNKKMDWSLPEEPAKTISGLVIDQIDTIPTGNVCINIESYNIETSKIEGNLIKELKISKNT